jgi:hypothetical protein
MMYLEAGSWSVSGAVFLRLPTRNRPGNKPVTKRQANPKIGHRIIRTAELLVAYRCARYLSVHRSR